MQLCAVRMSHACSRGVSDCACALRSVMRCTCTNVSCEWVFCLHHPSVVGKFLSRPTETGPI